MPKYLLLKRNTSYHSFSKFIALKLDYQFACEGLMKKRIIKTSKFSLSTFIFLICLTSVAQAHLFFNTIAEDHEEKLQYLKKDIEKLKNDVVEKIQDEKQRQKALQIIKEIEDRQEKIESSFRKLKAEGERIFVEGQMVAKDKKEVEKREKLFSMGFYALLVTAIVAIIGYIIRFPNIKLERRLMLLEIAEKKFEQKKRQKSISTNP